MTTKLAFLDFYNFYEIEIKQQFYLFKCSTINKIKISIIYVQYLQDTHFDLNLQKSYVNFLMTAKLLFLDFYNFSVKEVK